MPWPELMPGEVPYTSARRTMTNPPLQITTVAKLKVTVAAPVDAGLVREGQRRIVPITGGCVEGPVLVGEVLPGGADWQVVRVDGTTRMWARYDLRTHDGAVLAVTNTGVFATVDGRREAVTSVDMEAPDGPYEWLNDAVLIGSATPWPEGGVSLVFARVVAGPAESATPGE